MELNLVDAEIIVAGKVSDCSCLCEHCLLTPLDMRLSKVPYNFLHEIAERMAVYGDKHGVKVSLLPYNCCEYAELGKTHVFNQVHSGFSGYENLNGSRIE